MPKISIILPNYNTEKYLPRCLDSLIHQTFSDIEIIMIDDGSKDNSVKIAREYAKQDKRIQIIEQKNKGPAEARNKGLECATGKYLMFCDSDDWYEPNMCQVMFETIEREKVDVVCCNFFQNWDENLPLNEREKRLRNVINYIGKKSLSKKCILSSGVMLWNKIWRHDIIKKYSICFPSGHEHDDDAFWFMYAFVANGIFYLKDSLYHYFLRSDSIMSTQFNKKPKNRLDRLVICDFVLDFLLKNQLQKKHGRTMELIFQGELQGASRFFTPQEIQEFCFQINDKIKKMGSKQRLFYFNEQLRFYKTTNCVKLVYQRIWYYLCLYFWKILPSAFGKAHSHRYIDKISIVNFLLMYKKVGKF